MSEGESLSREDWERDKTISDSEVDQMMLQVIMDEYEVEQCICQIIIDENDNGHNK